MRRTRERHAGARTNSLSRSESISPVAMIVGGTRSARNTNGICGSSTWTSRPLRNHLCRRVHNRRPREMLVAASTRRNTAGAYNSGHSIAHASCCHRTNAAPQRYVHSMPPSTMHRIRLATTRRSTARRTVTWDTMVSHCAGNGNPVDGMYCGTNQEAARRKQPQATATAATIPS